MKTSNFPLIRLPGTPALASLARSESIYKGEKFSDHAPITIAYDTRL